MKLSGFEIKKSGKLFKVTYPDGRPFTMRFLTIEAAQQAVNDIVSGKWSR